MNFFSTLVPEMSIDLRFLQFLPSEIKALSVIRGQFPMLRYLKFGQFIAIESTQSSFTFTQRLKNTYCKNLHDLANCEIPARKLKTI